MAPSDSDRQEITDYVLGELGEEETTQLEIEFDRNVTLRSEREELRTISDLIAHEFESEEKFGLTPQQREAIFKFAAPADSISSAPPPVQQRPLQETITLSRDTDPWDRIEFLAVFVALLGMGFALAHLPTAVKALRIRWHQRFPVEGEGGSDELTHEPDFSESWLGLWDGQAPGYFRASMISALVGVALFAWIRMRYYPRKPMPIWCIGCVGAVYVVCLAGLIMLKN